MSAGRGGESLELGADERGGDGRQSAPPAAELVAVLASRFGIASLEPLAERANGRRVKAPAIDEPYQPRGTDDDCNESQDHH